MQETTSPYSISLNQTATVLMAVAVTELFPGALIVGGQGTATYFFYDFVFPFDFEPHFLSLIEERMRMILREKRELRLLEMMPSNAASMMTHSGQPLAAALLMRADKTTVEMCHIGGSAVYSPVPVLKELVIPFFKVLEGFELRIPEKKVIRIVGAATFQKDLLKKIAKLPSVGLRSHLNLAQKMEMLEPLSDPGFWLWLPRGERFRRKLVRFWEEEHEKQNFNIISSPTALMEGGGEAALSDCHREIFLRLRKQKTAEVALLLASEHVDPALGLFSPQASFVDRAYLFCSEEKLLEECISSLQFILKIPKILGFEYDIVLSVSSQGSKKARSKAVAVFQQALDSIGASYVLERGSYSSMLASVDVKIADALGRKWIGPFLGIPGKAMPEGKGHMLIRSMYGSLERIIALLLEHKGGSGSWEFGFPS